MKKLILLFVIAVIMGLAISYTPPIDRLPPISGQAWGGMILGGNVPVVGGPSIMYIGSPNTGGTPTYGDGHGNWSGYGASGDRVYSRSDWTATGLNGGTGTITEINVYVDGGEIDGGDEFYLVVYKGTDLIGYYEIAWDAIVNDAWTGYVTLVEDSADSLDIATNDVIRFGAGWEKANGNETLQLGVDSGDSDDKIEYDGTIWSSVPPPTASWSTSGTGSLGVIMKIEH